MIYCPVCKTRKMPACGQAGCILCVEAAAVALQMVMLKTIAVLDILAAEYGDVEDVLSAYHSRFTSTLAGICSKQYRKHELLSNSMENYVHRSTRTVASVSRA